MLYLRFLAGAGSVLVALLLAANAWLPQPAATSAPQDFDHPTIRIAATRKGPERVVIDTSLPTLAPPPAPAAVADVAAPPAATAAREAFAQLPAALSERIPPDAKPPTQEARLSPRKPAHRHLAARRAPEPLQPRRFATIFMPWPMR